MRRKNPNARSMLERMMECSELRISEVARSGLGHSKQVASRVLESAHVYQLWENSHGQAMRQIATEHRTRDQLLALKRMALSMVHRKAPFEYLRDRHVCGAARHRYFHELFGPHDFARAMVQEHQNYLVAGCSYLCVDTLCAPSTMERIVYYEKAYTSYWQEHTATLLSATRPAAHSRKSALMQILDENLRKARDRLLGAPPTRADQLTLDELRRPTGDTVRLQVLETQSVNFLTASRPFQSTDARQ